MKSNGLFKNTAMLYVLTATNYIFGFVTVPYLTRVLGPETYGIVGFGTSLSVYMQLIMDFGFILSATAEVSNDRDSLNSVSNIMSAVIQAKIALCIVCASALALLCCTVETFGKNTLLLFLYLLYVSINAFIPDFVYRGLERMEIVTYRTVAMKAVFVVFIFIFVKNPGDYLLVPLFYALGALFAAISVFAHLHFRVGVNYRFVSLAATLLSIKKSSHYFVSRIASTFYSSLNILVIGFLWPESAVLGCYSATDKAMAAGKSASSPVADSMYPYMIRTKNYNLLVKVALIASVVLLAICFPCWIFSTDLCLFLFGDEYAFAGSLLRILLPIIPISLINYLFGFPALAPMGLSKVANYSVVAGAGLQCVLLATAYVLGVISVELICVVTVVTEILVMMIRLIAFIYGLKSKVSLSADK